jgi:hypothetical protein
VRYLRFLLNELHGHEESGLLTLRQTHEMTGDVSERLNALRLKLDRDRAPLVMPLEEEPARPRRRRREAEEPVEDETPRRTILEVLLDPHSIQWLLAAGGALIVLGVVIWLASLGLFENAGFVAVALGVGNAALLAGGYFMILRTTHQNAGRALTLLACLLMPLNLWFYHTHNLITLEQHLWVAALFCCIIYTASALVLKDSLFVYVLVAGVTLTGLLLLAQYHHFGEVLAPVTFFIVLGLICLHVERAFPDTDGPFARRNFGMAFYWCSVALFAFGLLELLVAQMVGWLHHQIWPNVEPFDVVKTEHLPWTLALVLAGTYAYIYSDLVVRKIGIYTYLAGITILWAEIHILVLSDLANAEAIIIITLALTALAINVFQVSFEKQHGFLTRVAPMGLLFTLLPVAYGTLLHFRATNNVLEHFWKYEITWAHVAAMGVAALSYRASAFLYRHTLKEVSVVYFFLTAIATLLFAASLAWMIGVRAWEKQAPLIMIVPILYLIAAYFYRGHSPENPLIWTAYGAVAVTTYFSIWVALGITPQVDKVEPLAGNERNLYLALFCLEAALFYGVAAFLRRTDWSIYFATVMLCGAIWQFLRFFNTPDELYAIAFTLPGFVLLVLYRFGVLEKMEMANLERTTFQSANALTTLGFASGALLALTRLLQSDADLARLGDGEWRTPIRILLVLVIFLTIVSVVSIWLVQHQAWRRVYVVHSIINSGLLILVIHRLSELSAWQRLEIFSIVVGVALLIYAFIGWYRETEWASDLVSQAFFFGSLAVATPLFLASTIHRFFFTVSPIDEGGLVGACVVLFASGVLCRVKAPTIIGAVTILLYVLMVLIYMTQFLKETVIVGIYLTLGGVLLFGTGLVLSIYRDRLLALPGKFRRREGVFRIFDWR